MSQSFFDLPKRTERNNINIRILFERFLNNVRNIYRDFAGFDMRYDEFMDLCREAWKDEDYKYFFDSSKKKVGNIVLVMKTIKHI